MNRSSTPGSGDVRGGDFRAQVLAAVDIVELIGQSVALKRRGKDYVGLCPFHQEKSPSFHVSQAKQFFHCYGCKAAGTIFDFVMKRDRVEFKDALRTLGEMAGLEMPQYGGNSREKSSQRQQLLEACSAACALFEKLLADPVGKAARNYLDERGFNAEAIRKFQIGFAPEAWDTIVRSPIARKFPPDILATAGLIKPRTQGEGFYDTFRNRVMFPIRDEAGRVIAFGGRVMPGSEDPAKYLNSPETPLFSKSRSVFGLDLGRQRIVETKTVAVVEGYTDVVMAHQFGASNVVSILGTAMTEQHVTLLRRFAEKIVLLFDADTAGDTAVNRAIELFMTQPVDFAIASMPADTDPDEYLLQNGVEGFAKLLTEAPSVLNFMVRQFKRKWKENDGNLPAQERATEAFVEPFLKARQTGERDRWPAIVAALSKEIGVSTEELNRKYLKTQQLRPRPQSAFSAEAASTARSGASTNASRRLLNAQERAERFILGVLLSEPDRWRNVQEVVHVEDFTDDARRRLGETYWQHQRDEGELVLNEFLSGLTDSSLVELAVELVDELSELSDLEGTLTDSVLHLAEVRKRREEQKHMSQLRRTDAQLGEQDEVSALRKIQESSRTPNLRRVGS